MFWAIFSLTFIDLSFNNDDISCVFKTGDSVVNTNRCVGSVGWVGIGCLDDWIVTDSLA